MKQRVLLAISIALTSASSAVSAGVAADSNQAATNTAPATTNDTTPAAGRSDPFSPITRGIRPFPAFGPSLKEPKKVVQHHIPPPPTSLIPPPPPGVPTMSEQSTELPIEDLPPPPEKPSLAAKMRLVGIIDDRALFTLNDNDDSMTRPYVIALKPGEQFQTVTLLSVDANGVMVEEDGARTVFTLERIK